MKLDTYEQDIENNTQEYKSISPSKKKLVTDLIKKAKVEMNIRSMGNAQDSDHFDTVLP
jgi:hypothetical protein